MLAALQEQIDALREDSSIKVVILSGTGKGFCAGHDIKQMTAGRAAEDGGKAYFQDLFARCTRVMMGLQSLPQPVIAQVHGIATAAGCQLVASCDLAVAADGHQVRRQRGEHRPFLLHPDGGAVAQHPAQASV